MDVFEKADIQRFRYSAIIDNSTTPFCSYHDNHMISTANKLWGEVQIPNHYQCRAIFSPVFEDEDFVDNWNDGVPAEYQHPQAGFGV